MRRIFNLAVVVFVIAAGLFVTNNPIHSSGIGSTDVRSLFVCSPIPIDFGDSVNGVLEAGDCVDSNTAVFDGYTFTGIPGEQIDVVMGSAAFSSSLRLVQGSYPGGTVLATGSDIGNGNRRISAFAIPSAGTYTIVASSSIAGTSGAYSLRFEPTIPRVSLIQRISSNPAVPGSTVVYSVFFNTAVTGVDVADFALTTNGVSGASISSVSGSGTIYTLSINTGSGVGSLRLDVVDNDTIINGLSTPLGGLGIGNGTFTTGPSYTIAASTPTPSPTPPLNTLVVTNTNDDGAGSLRQAINDVATGGVITFSSLFNVPQTITLESELRIVKNLLINGPGPNLLTVSGNNTVRVLNIGGFSPGFTVGISGLTIANGRAPNNDFGGGIEKNFGDLTLSNCAVTGNNVSGTGSGGSGAGIDNYQGPLTISGCAITGNTANGSGGGIQSEDGNLTITNSTISGNTGRNGGGVFSLNGSVSIDGTTLSGNTAVVQGGGAFIEDGNLTIVSSTVSGNTANNAGAGLTLRVSSGDRTSRITNCTIANNISPAGAGGGLLVSGSGSASAIFRGTIIANNAEPNMRVQNATASISSQGFNLTNGSGNGFLNQSTDKLNADAGLAPLADNGGPTRTHALLATSTAIDAGNSSGLVNDQRGIGFTRAVDLSFPNVSGGDGADIGAFELQSEPMPASATISGRVVTPSGLGLRNAVVSLIDPQGVRTNATTSSFGIFTFNNVPTGASYIVSVSSKRYRFAARSIAVNGNLSNLDFTGLE